jgi:hypothetical protein
MAQGRHGNAVKNLSHKCIKQQVASIGFIDATALQVKDFISIQLADGGTVGTLYLVSGDF